MNMRMKNTRHIETFVKKIQRREGQLIRLHRDRARGDNEHPRFSKGKSFSNGSGMVTHSPRSNPSFFNALNSSWSLGNLCEIGVKLSQDSFFALKSTRRTRMHSTPPRSTFVILTRKVSVEARIEMRAPTLGQGTNIICSSENGGGPKPLLLRSSRIATTFLVVGSVSLRMVASWDLQAQVPIITYWDRDATGVWPSLICPD